jgi:DNA repair photolyase
MLIPSRPQSDVIVPPLAAIKGRGSLSNERGRFEAWRREKVYDDLGDAGGVPEQQPPKPKTTVWIQQAKSIISTNQSPDLPFETSINPYQGCEHGCIYCYARPTHAYLGLSPGLDFETRLFAKKNAVELLIKELSNKNYVPKVINLGANTDPYQPIERDYKITRGILDVLERYQHPVTIVTKSGVVMRDMDILERMAKKNLARVFVSITSLKSEIARTLEPRASTPARRLATVKKLAEAGIPVGVLMSPIIPTITDVEIEDVVAAAAEAGATYCSYILLRLPREIKELFGEWLQAHFPLRAKHVESLLMQMRGGKVYDAAFGKRMKGEGIFAEMLANRFKLARQKHGIDNERGALRTDLFVRPVMKAATPQLALF